MPSRPTSSISPHRTLSLLSVALLGALATAQSDRPDATHIFITYRCKAPDRPAFRRQLLGEEIERLQAWKSAGVMADFVLTFNPVVDEATWDATLVLTFHRYAQTARWREIERDFPGGLGPKALSLATPCTTYFADREITAGKAGDRSMSTFLYIPYTCRDRAEYLDFIRVYGVPQFDAWIEQKIIANYSIFVNHHSTGRPWDSMLVFEYVDIEALGRRDIVKWQVRKDLVKQPDWKLASGVKREIREEHEVVMGEPLVGK